MAVNTASLTTSATITDVQFRAIIDFIKDVLQSGGCLLVADSGDLDSSTITWPGANNTAAGYEIRRFSDAMQATDPVFFKIEYGRGAGTGNFSIWLTMGTGSDGAGTITGSKKARTQYNMTTAASTKSCWCSAGTNRFCFNIGQASATDGGFMGLERTIDVAKAVTNRGLMQVWRTAGTSFSSHFINYQGTSPAAEDGSGYGGGCLPPSAQTTGLYGGGDTSIYPFFVFGVGETLVPTTLVVGVFSGDFTTNNQYPMNLVGANQNMIVLDKAGAWGANRGGSGVGPTATNFTIAMRYD